MTKRVFLWAGLCLALAWVSTGSAQALTCAECEAALGGDLSILEMLDFNGNGFSTLDLVVIRRLQLETGLTNVTVNNLVPFAISGQDANGGAFDLTGDGVYTSADYNYLQKIVFFINATGQGSVNLDLLLECGRMYILGICP